MRIPGNPQASVLLLSFSFYVHTLFTFSPIFLLCLFVFSLQFFLTSILTLKLNNDGNIKGNRLMGKLLLPSNLLVRGYFGILNIERRFGPFVICGLNLNLDSMAMHTFH